ncbi:helix-turn-helix domain-containing protein [Sphingosinithalassobacter sp. LHW66-3]|uniref:helix-turn-helix domain-containing protein n=1 Tax=Sphingosinithalassobacter sp. LHW66-3 TaxID=3424718 RepID=UPI003D6C1E4E
MIRPSARLLRVDAHDDGVNAWSMAHFAPGQQLAGWIGGYCDYEERTGGFTVRRELPNTQAVLLVNLGEPIALVGGDGGTLRLGAGEAFVAGTHLRPALSQSTGAQRGVHVFLSPVALRRLTGVPMHELRDRVVPLEALFGVAAATLGAALGEAADRAERVRLIEAALEARLARTADLRAVDLYALRQTETLAGVELAEIARDIGWSRKHLASRITDLVGVGPRSWRRLRRFERAVGLAESGDRDWAGIAAECGYCDQSHLIREFQEFAGLTPRAFAARLVPGGGGLIER